MLGKIAENFILLDQYSNTFNLYENLNQKILLVFYPKDDTPVCNMQLLDYDMNLDLFHKHNIKVVGINIGDVSEHKSFCEKKGFNFAILSDSEKKVSKMYNALNIFGQNKRKLVLIGEDKKILYEHTVPSFLFTNTDKVIEALQRLKII